MKTLEARDLIDHLRENCEDSFTLDVHISLDEQDIGFQGRFAVLKEKIKYKKEGDGFLADALCDAASGYTYTFWFRGDKTWAEVKEGASDLHNRCLHLFERVKAKQPVEGLVVCMDNLFTSLKFFMWLFVLFGVYAVGVCRTSNRGFDKRIEQREATTKKGVVLAKRTFKKSCYTNGNFKCLAASYYDSKPVHMLSSYHQDAKEVPMIRKVWDATLGKFTDMIFYRLDIIDFYNKWMDGVDMADQLMWYYRLNTKQHRYRKWWWPIFLWAVNVAITNSYIMYKILKLQAEEERQKKLQEWQEKQPTLRASARKKDPPEHLRHRIKRYSHRQFRAILAQQLVHGDRDWKQHVGTSKRTADRKRQMAAELQREKHAPVHVVEAKKEGQSDRFYSNLRLYSPETWPDARLSCPAEIGQVRGEIVGIKEKHDLKCQICYSRLKKRVAAQIYCKNCSVKTCSTPWMDDYHGKHVHKHAWGTGAPTIPEPKPKPKLKSD